MNIRTGGSCAAVLAALCAVMAPPAAARETGSEDRAARLATVTVQSPPLGGQGVEVRPEDLAAGRELADALRDIAGVSGSRMGGHGTDVFIRGLGADRINVVLDGAWVEGACPNRMDPATAYASSLGYDRITVIRGVATLERPGAPGGSVLLERETPAFVDGERLRVRAEGGWRGNGGVLEAGADLAAGNGSGFVRVFGSTADAGNYTAGDGDRVRSAYEDAGAGAIIGWTPDRFGKLELSVEARRLRDVLFAGAGMDSPRSDTEIFRLDYASEPDGLWTRFEVGAFASRVDHLMDNYSLREPPGPMMRLSAPSTSDTSGLRALAERRVRGGLLRLGVDARRNERSAVRVNDASGMLQSVLWPDVTIDRAGAFSEWNRAIGRRYRLLAGLRYDRVRARADAVDRPPALGLAPSALYLQYAGSDGRGSRLEHHVGGLLRLERKLGPGEGYAALSRTFRTADATERFLASNAPQPSRRWVGNPELDPERHDQFEFGWFVDRESWEVDVSLFFDSVADYILRDRTGRPADNATIYRNVDARRVGGEFAAGVRLGGGWRARVEAAAVRATNRSDDRPVAQTPPMEGAASLERDTGRWLWGVRVRAAARQDRVDADPVTGSGLDVGRTPGWTVFDLYAEFRWRRGWRLRAGVDNLLDRDYAQHLNRSSAFDVAQVQVDEPGRSAWIRLSWTY